MDQMTTSCDHHHDHAYHGVLRFVHTFLANLCQEQDQVVHIHHPVVQEEENCFLYCMKYQVEDVHNFPLEALVDHNARQLEVDGRNYFQVEVDGHNFPHLQEDVHNYLPEGEVVSVVVGDMEESNQYTLEPDRSEDHFPNHLIL